MPPSRVPLSRVLKCWKAISLFPFSLLTATTCNSKALHPTMTWTCGETESQRMDNSSESQWPNQNQKSSERESKVSIVTSASMMKELVWGCIAARTISATSGKREVESSPLREKIRTDPSGCRWICARCPSYLQIRGHTIIVIHGIAEKCPQQCFVDNTTMSTVGTLWESLTKC